MKKREAGALSFKNYAGYTIIDIGDSLAFAAMGSFLSVFYTDVLGISTAAATVIMVAARIWDGINDPIMGFFVQSRHAGKHGKYRPYILFGGIFMSVVAALVFLPVNQYFGITSNAALIAWAATTYILYGMLYTVVLVPYGSLASVMTQRVNERSLLSVCRSIGGGIGSLPAAIIFPMVVWADSAKTVLDGTKLFVAMAIVAIIMIIMYITGVSCTKENVPPQEDGEKLSIGQTFRSVIHDKAFVLVSLIGCLLIASSTYLNTVNVYIFKDYFGNGSLTSLYTIIAYLPMLIMIPLVNLVIKKIGKKEINVIGLAISTVASLILFLIKTDSSIVYMILSFFVNCGVSFITLEIWAMAMDVIDHQEMLTGVRREAADYAIFTFMRKVGQALAAFAPMLLGLAGYDTDLVGMGQSAETVSAMYSVATFVPFVLFALMLVLMLAYPLNRKKSLEMAEALAASRGEKEN